MNRTARTAPAPAAWAPRRAAAGSSAARAASSAPAPAARVAAAPALRASAPASAPQLRRTSPGAGRLDATPVATRRSPARSRDVPPPGPADPCTTHAAHHPSSTTPSR